MAPRKKPAAAPVAMTPELFAAILERISGGALLAAVCQEPGIPSRTAFYKFVRETPGARALLDEAIAERGEWRAEKIHELANQVTAGKLDPQSARVAIDAHRFLAAKEAPRRYGDKIEMTGKDGRTLIPEGPVGAMELARWVGFVMLTGRDAARKAAEAAEQESTEQEK